MQTTIILILCLLMGFTSYAADFKPVDSISLRDGIQMKADTGKNNQFIKVDPFSLEIVPPSSGIQFYRDGIIYLSSSKSEGKMLAGHISFGGINTKYAVLKDTVLENPQVFSPTLNFLYPTDAITFSDDFNTMYFTKYQENEGVEKIYQAKLTPGEVIKETWTVDEMPMSFCTGKYTYTHPAISRDGKIMIFASNRDGTIGSLDLFVSLLKGGTWSDPLNLGNAINSKSNELYPYLDSENNLFFSSNGIQGFGGYDIYVCKFKVNTWDSPINLGSPINTRFDDVAFTLNRKDGKSAFYTVKQKAAIEPVKLFRATINNNDGTENNMMTLSNFFTNPTLPHIVLLVLEPAVQATDKKTETARQKSLESVGNEDIVVYRVQFSTSFNPRTRTNITVKGKDYSVFEYLYSGAYRLCVGEFTTLAPARDLQRILNQDDYPQAIVVAFKNNVRSLDPELLKDQPGYEPATVAEKKVISEPAPQVKPQEIKAEPEKIEVPAPEVKKAEPVKAEPKKAEPTKAEPVKAEPAKPSTTQQSEQKDIVTYRIQIISSNKSRGTYKLAVNNKEYDTFEYLYSGVYRTCVGEFSTLKPAKEFQTICRQNGYPQAFVVAFKNNIRSTDPALFK